jgi:hypothetical protein
MRDVEVKARSANRNTKIENTSRTNKSKQVICKRGGHAKLDGRARAQQFWSLGILWPVGAPLFRAPCLLHRAATCCARPLFAAKIQSEEEQVAWLLDLEVHRMVGAEPLSEITLLR